MGEMRLGVTTKGGDIGAGEIAMGEMRLGVTTKGVDIGEIAMGEMRLGVTTKDHGKVCGLSAVSDSGRVGGGWPFLAKPASAMGEGTVLMASGFSTCALIVACVSDHGGGWPFLAKPASAMGEGTVSMASGGLFKSVWFICFLRDGPLLDGGRHMHSPPPWRLSSLSALSVRTHLGAQGCMGGRNRFFSGRVNFSGVEIPSRIPLDYRVPSRVLVKYGVPSWVLRSSVRGLLLAEVSSSLRTSSTGLLLTEDFFHRSPPH
ncbi:unnamed protein product [Boreogadus saida]